MNLEEIRARAEAATPGPWTHEEYGFGITAKERKLYFTYGCDSQTFTDMDFVCHAREDIPALLAEVERLEQDLLELNEANTVLHGAWESQYAELAATQKQLEAAVEDMTHTAHNCVSKDECGVVKLDHSYCFKCVAWKWRGAREAQHE